MPVACPCWRPWTRSCPRHAPQISPCACRCRTCTRLAVSGGAGSPGCGRLAQPTPAGSAPRTHSETRALDKGLLRPSCLPLPQCHRLSGGPSIRLSIRHPSLHADNCFPPHIHLSIHPSIHLHVRSSIRTVIHPSVCLTQPSSIRPPSHPLTHMPISVHTPVHPRPSICPSIRPPTHPYPFIHLSRVIFPSAKHSALCQEVVAHG